MRRSWIVLFASLAAGCVVLAQPPSAAPPLVVRDVTLIDGNGAPPRGNVNLLCRDGRVAANRTEPLDPAITIDGRGIFALPDITDAHVHLSGLPWPERTAQLARVLHRRGQEMGSIVITAGVDSLTVPNDPLPAIHEALELMVTGAKLTPLQAITAATRGAAHAMGVDDTRGTIAGEGHGSTARRRRSVAGIRNTRRIRCVIKDGRIVHMQEPRR
jgi:imidazolonepropionase-like amidohydrolase